MATSQRVGGWSWVVVVAAVLLAEAAWAEAPVGRFTVNADGTVKDNKTQLVWQREVPVGGYTWDDAKSHCTGLSLGGQPGWRLPTKRELESIVDDSRYSPAIDVSAFPNTPGEWFWSSSPHAYYSNVAWNVGFHDGSSGYDFVSFSLRVRCVR